MASLRYDIARAFVNGQRAANSTKSFRSEIGSRDLGPYVTVLYTYQAPMAVRFNDGSIALLAGAHTHFSNTSSSHQKALKVVLDNPNFGTK